MARDAPTAAPAGPVSIPSGPAPAQSEEDRIKALHKNYDTAVAEKKWQRVAVLVNGFSDGDMADKLNALSAADLRLVDDGAQRSNVGLGRVRSAVQVALGGKGVSAARAKAGAQYGDLKLEVKGVKDGVLDEVKYEYPVKISFTPDPAVVKAEEISFVQSVRFLEMKTGNTADWDEGSRNRQTKNKTSIDRQHGFKQGWYGMEDDASNGRFLNKWTKAGAGSNPTAWMVDVPGSATHPGTSWAFETAVVSRTGPDAGTVYATVTWGFKADENMKVTALATKIFNKQSAELSAAVGEWNEQAAGPQGESNVPSGGGQVNLPGLS
jgi:hypothetical protein